MSIKFGIMQGRLTKTNSNLLQKFPADWSKEFDFIKKTSLDYIEFFTEKNFNKKNPLWSNNGIKKIKKKISKVNYKEIIVCDNYVISHSLDKISTEKYLKLLIDQLSNFKKSKLIIPIVSNKLNNKKFFLNYILSIKKLLDYSNKKKVKLSFEIENKINICQKICLNFSENKNFGITFDVGNAYLFDKDFYTKFKSLKKFINHIHLKDRDKHGKNVVLGKGKVKFKLFFQKLNSPKKYNGTITFETNRGEDPIKIANSNYQIIKNL